MQGKQPPRSLGEHGRSLWRTTVSKYEFTPTELEVLFAMCVATDQLQRIGNALKAAHLTSTGSQGQLTGHPLLNEFRQHSETVRRLARQLDLPDDDAKQPVKKKTNPKRVSHLVRAGA
jgi:phage terminase small subunit